MFRAAQTPWRDALDTHLTADSERLNSRHRGFEPSVVDLDCLQLDVSNLSRVTVLHILACPAILSDQPIERI